MLLFEREDPVHLNYHEMQINRGNKCFFLWHFHKICQTKAICRISGSLGCKRELEVKVWIKQEDEGSWGWESNGSRRTTCAMMGMGGLTMLGTKAAKLSCFH